ncbi:ABC transporter substrate-binding protein [Chelatococcus asaccharovorans]|uniref:Peptide/nickel transport system substrate-binding protein n=1 Tax=Chelatococcus asaccharovorans TaxID=28210 RepID=A0A2V3UHP7_9HYPH|nr:ABC transporter substrate-binding protein [Chelatococcus asaccharovorans]MBS7701740.1 ABC transporter substrate-binding protein [Chelatococcus asaccharovorans]PXW64553.1 peptide/nickel transport system substrate-binding protein [Chelatococcus asaccharovorans]
MSSFPPDGLPLTRRAMVGALAALGLSTLPVPLSAQDTPVRGGILTVSLSTEAGSIAAVNNTTPFAYFISSKILEGLLSYDFDYNPQPELATEWAVSEDGLRYWFRLREGVRWHDGKPFDAKDVVFSILLQRDVHPRGRRVFRNVTAVNALGSHEVEILLSEPAPYLLVAFAGSGVPIAPAHIYAGTDIAANPANNAPIGTGPFRFVEWVRGSHIILERNDDYWDQPRPYLDGIVYRFVFDPLTQVAGIETGEVHLTPTGVPLSELDRLRRNPQLGIETRGFGYNNTIVRLEFNLDHPHLSDLRVRQAIAHAIDVETIASTAYQGQATPLYGPVSPGLAAFYDPNLPRYAVDPARAEALLDEAGLRRGADGVRFEVFLDPVQPTGPIRQTADYIAQALGKIGIRVTIRGQDFATYVRRIYTARDFDIALQGLSNLYDPVAGIQGLFWSRSIEPGVPFVNAAHYRSAETDRLLEAAAIETNTVRRRTLYDAFQRQVVADLPALHLVAPDAFTVYNTRVRDHTLTVDGFGSRGAHVWLAR